jgi:hypothetical protein
MKKRVFGKAQTWHFPCNYQKVCNTVFLHMYEKREPVGSKALHGFR